MRIFIYEYITAGGWLGEEASAPPPATFRREGMAMLSALAADFAGCSGAETIILCEREAAASFRDHSGVDSCQVIVVDSAHEERERFARLATEADWTIVIAPECDGALLDRARLVESSGGRLLGPPSSIIALCGDKHRTCEHLVAHGVPVPRGGLLAPGELPPLDATYPAVLKPLDGAGSQGTRVIASLDELPRDRRVAYRFEEFRPGMPASVAFLCGPGQLVPLPPCRQSIAGDGSLAYLGGAPLPLDLAERATRLATRAIETLDSLRGYIGVDLILGPDARGKDDVIMEINPRLTTSYVGLRGAARTNLAGAMLDAASGWAAGRQTALAFRDVALEFDSAGHVRQLNGQLG